MARLFGRVASLIVGARRFDGPRYVDNRWVPGFRIAFTIQASHDVNANKAEAKIYHLAAPSRAQFALAKRARFAVEAGYLETSGSLFDGQTQHVGSIVTPEGYETKVSAADGLQARRGIVSASLAPGATVGQFIKAVADAMGVGSKKAVADALAGRFDGALGRFYSGAALQGAAARVMDGLAQSAGFEWSIQAGELVITAPGGVADQTVIKLGPRTGMLGSPERRRDEKTNREIVVVRSMLQAGLRVAKHVQIESDEISGLFRIQTVRHVGDTHGADWYSEIEAR